VLENQFSQRQEVNERGAEIIELLRRYEEVMRPLRNSAEGVALEHEIVKEAIRHMVEEGVLQPTVPMKSLKRADNVENEAEA